MYTLLGVISEVIDKVKSVAMFEYALTFLPMQQQVEASTRGVDKGAWRSQTRVGMWKGACVEAGGLKCASSKRKYSQEVQKTAHTTEAVRQSANAPELEAKVAQLQEDCSTLRQKNEELRDKAYKAVEAVAQSERTTSQLVQDTKVCRGASLLFSRSLHKASQS